MQILNTSTIKRKNEEAILEVLRKKGSATIRQISSETQLSYPTISKILEEMQDRICISDTQEITGGRNATVYRLNSEYEYRLLAYYYPQTIKYEVRDAINDIVEKKKYHFEGNVGDELVELAVTMKARYPMLNAAAIGLPGVVNDGVAIHVICADSLNGRNLQSEISAKCNIACVVENDMKAIVREATIVYEAEHTSLACLYFNDKGPGCGISVNGEVLRGVNGYAGEIGFVPVDDRTVLREAADGYDRYCARLIASIAALINPQTVVFFTNGLQPEIDDLQEKLLEYLPPALIPQIVLSHDHELVYFNGLMRLAVSAGDQLYLNK